MIDLYVQKGVAPEDATVVIDTLMKVCGGATASLGQEMLANGNGCTVLGFLKAS